MNKNYSGTIDEIKSSLILDVNELLANSSITIKNVGDAIIKSVDDLREVNGSLDFIISVTVNENIKKYGIFSALKAKIVAFKDEIKLAELTDFSDYLDTDYAEKLNEAQSSKFEEEQKLRAEAREIKKIEVKNKKLEAKRAAQKDSNVRNTNILSAMKFDISKVTEDEFVSIGYIAKHIKKIEARMPDYLEEWFISEFGDAERMVFDSSKVTSGGFQLQWSLALKIELDTNDNIPSMLVPLLGEPSRKVHPISNTRYVFNLCKNFGFKFGKSQNIDDIISNIPEDKLDSFKIGCELA